MAKGPNSSPKFEDAVKEIETILASMESGDLPLERLIESYDKAKKLLNGCQKALEVAELKIQQLNKDTGETEPFGI